MDNVFEVTSTKSVNGVIEADSRKRIWGVENMASTHIDTATSSKRIGDLLLEAELLSPECLEKGLQISKERHQRLGEVLVEQGWVDPYHLVEVLGQQLKIPVVDLRGFHVQKEAVRLVPESLARKLGVMPLAIQEEELMVATSEPQDIAALGDLQAATRKKIRPTLAIKAHIDQTINRYYKLTDSICAQIASTTEAAIRVGPGDPNATAVVQIVQLVIAQAVREWASDVYFEPRDGEVQVRFRVNGQLRDSIKLPGPLQAPLVRRIKVMSKIDSGEARQLQEGRFSMKVGETQTEVRVTIVTTDKGDLVALRLLDDANTILPLKQLGFWPAALEAYTKVLDRPFGLVLISGPSGSGKTTTLFASLQHFTERNRDVVTVEEPVEYRLPTIKQIQVNDHGTTAADAINNALRLSPDVLLVSDIREASTARAVLRAASTGHLVLSCIEANDTVSALFRFKDLDVDLRLLAPDLTGCVYQRLVRRICPYCRQAYQPSPEEMAAFRRITSQDTGEFYKGVGCNFCDQSGYMGLAGLFEVLPVSNDIKTLLSKGASYGEIREQAIKEGMVTIQQDGMLKAAQGTTTIAEFMRVIPFLES